jgi:DNA helicase-2/ATP-dependent DNA helicase PcrA
LLIVASAGTGKTTTIVNRYINMVENHGFNPEEIMMTTFTNKSARDINEKIKKYTKKMPKYIGTMHSIFLKILRITPD